MAVPHVYLIIHSNLYVGKMDVPKYKQITGISIDLHICIKSEQYLKTAIYLFFFFHTEKVSVKIIFQVLNLGKILT